MANVLTLDAIEEELEHEFAPLTLEAGGEQFVLRNLLRLGETDRQTVLQRLTELESLEGTGETDSAQVDTQAIVQAAEAVLRTITAEARGDRLVELLGGDMLRTTRVLQKWSEVSQPGEAPNSPA